MLKPQLADVFKRIYAVLPRTLQYSLWKVMFLAVTAALMEFMLAGAVSLLGVALASPQSITQSSIMQQLLDWQPSLQTFCDDPRLLLTLLLCMLCAAVLLKTLLLALLTWRQSVFSQEVSKNVGVRLYAAFLYAPYLWHTSQKISHLMTVLDWRASLGLFLFAGLQVISQLIVTGILIVTICLMAPLASVLILTTTGVSAWLIFRFSRTWIQRLGQQCAVAQQDSIRMIHTGLNGIREVMIYQQQESFIAQYADAETRYTYGQSLLPVFPPLPSWVMEWIGIMLLLGTVLLLYWQDASLAHVSATLALLAAVAWRLLPVMNRVIQNMIGMQQQLPMLEPVLHMLQEAEHVAHRSIDDAPCELQRALELRDVHFRYPAAEGQEKDALCGINMHIPKGGMIGLIGPSGAGKSTVVGLLTGLYSPSEGQILVDGAPLQEKQRSAWMRGIGYVPQSPFLLNATILENIAFSQWGHEINRERALRCCHMAAMDFLEELSEGIDTVIGERGVRLSGGQIQRVAIARALYSDPQILLFDEATSALDGASEQAIQHTINSLSGQVTMIVIAHRLTTVEKCDFLYWIDKGTITMQGRPDEVLPRYSRYLEHCATAMIDKKL